MNNEYELISHNNSNFNIFLVNLSYRTPHIHRDFEISIILYGEVALSVSGEVYCLSTGDIFVMNPFLGHEIKSNTSALILSLQVSPRLFASYCPEMDQLEFDKCILSLRENRELCRKITEYILNIAANHFKHLPFASLDCAAGINDLFAFLLKELPYHLIDERLRKAAMERTLRMQRIMEYIDAHFTEKLLLKDIAQRENLDLYYLSHFFKDCFGLSFQEYVAKLRCEKARELLISTNYSLLDVSISCGFSDAKYLNRGFEKQYGCTPKQYRSKFKGKKPDEDKFFMFTDQQILSDKASIEILEELSGKW